MEIKQMIDDVARAKNDLAGLLDADIPPRRLQRCQSAVADLETGVSEILGTAWIPRTVPELTVSIYQVRENMRRVQDQIDGCIDDVIDRAQPDELFRVWAAMAFGRLLEFELDALMSALALVTPEAEWLN